MGLVDTPFRLLPAVHVEPGMVVLTTTGALLVDEVRRDLTSVQLLGWPAGRSGRGRRSSLQVSLDGDPESGADEVRVLPSGKELAELRAALFNMATLAAAWEMREQDDAGTRLEPGESAFGVKHSPDGDWLLVRSLGVRWLLPLVAPDEPAVEVAE